MYKQKEIVLVPFPYSNLSSIKKRPVLIVSNNNYNSNYPAIVVCVITRNLFKDNFSVALTNDDLENGILPELSIMKCHKLFTIRQSQIIKKFSLINKEKFMQVNSLLKTLFEESV